MIILGVALFFLSKYVFVKHKHVYVGDKQTTSSDTTSKDATPGEDKTKEVLPQDAQEETIEEIEEETEEPQAEVAEEVVEEPQKEVVEEKPVETTPTFNLDSLVIKEEEKVEKPAKAEKKD